MELAHPSGDIVIEHCEKYTYLGSIFTADGIMNTVLTEHVKNKSKHLLKLRIETGRWARITRENRLCPCGLMQTEQHIIENCNLLSNIRECYPGMTFNFDILLNTAEPDMFKVIYDMLNYFS